MRELIPRYEILLQAARWPTLLKASFLMAQPYTDVYPQEVNRAFLQKHSIKIEYFIIGTNIELTISTRFIFIIKKRQYNLSLALVQKFKFCLQASSQYHESFQYACRVKQSAHQNSCTFDKKLYCKERFQETRMSIINNAHSFNLIYSPSF